MASPAPDPGPGFRSNQLDGGDLAVGEGESLPERIQQAAAAIIHWCGGPERPDLDLIVEKFQLFDLATHCTFVPALRSLSGDEVKQAIALAVGRVSPPQPKLAEIEAPSPPVSAGLASPDQTFLL